MKHGYTLGLAPHNAGERGGRADVIRRTEYGGTVDPGVAICRIGCVQLITAANPGKIMVVFDANINGKGVVAWNTKDMLDPECRKSLNLLHLVTVAPHRKISEEQQQRADMLALMANRQIAGSKISQERITVFRTRPFQTPTSPEN